MYLNKFLLNNMRTLLISTRWIKNDEICINIWQYLCVHCSQLTSIKYVKVFLSFVFFFNENLPLSICMYGSISLTSLHELSFMMCCGLCAFSTVIKLRVAPWDRVHSIQNKNFQIVQYLKLKCILKILRKVKI